MNMLRMLSAGAAAGVAAVIWLPLVLLGTWLLKMETAAERWGRKTEV